MQVRMHKLHYIIMEKDLLQLSASVLQHESTALRAACARTAAGCAAGAAAGCPGLSCRAGPCCGPGAVCRGRDSAACQAQHSAARGAAQGAAGRRVGGRSPPAQQGRAGQGRAGQGPSAATAAAWGRGLTATLLHRLFLRAGGEARQGFSFSCFQGKGKY